LLKTEEKQVSVRHISFPALKQLMTVVQYFEKFKIDISGENSAK